MYKMKKHHSTKQLLNHHQVLFKINLLFLCFLLKNTTEEMERSEILKPSNFTSFQECKKVLGSYLILILKSETKNSVTL